MPKDAVQFPSADGCVYILDLNNGRWKKVCDVDCVPADVREQAQKVVANIDVLKKAIR